ncbi:MAG: hypothetical protein RL653_4533 [Pseudomonadota bacterium]|jgi:aminopeptidase N
MSHRHAGCRGHAHAGREDAHPFSLPGATEHYAAPRPVRVQHVALDVSLDFDRAAVKGTCTTRLSAVREVDTVTFDAVELDVSDVSVDGRPATFSNSGRHLHVTLPRTLKAGATVEVRVKYGARPSRGLYFLKPDPGYPDRPLQAWTQGQDEDSRCWFPCLDAPAQKATTELRATFPERFTSLSNGACVSDKVSRGKRTQAWRLDIPHAPYLVTLVVGEFEEVTHPGKTPLRYLFPRGRRDDALRAVQRTPEMLSLFEKLTGERYPWGSYAQVFVSDFIFGGMENTSATTLTDEVMHDARAALEYAPVAESLVAHELAHQWFGDLLTCRDWPHGWLNEGFATYAEVLWRETADGLDAADQQRREDLDAYLAEAGGRYARPIVARKFHEPIDLFDRHLYEKGGAVLHELRRRLGDELFFKVLPAWVKAHRGQSVETHDFARTVEAVTGHNLDRFFDQYVMSPGHPQLKVDVAWMAEEKQLRVTVKQVQPTTGENAFPLFELPLDVEWVVNGKERTGRLQVKEAEQAFHLRCEAEPSQVRVDPRREVLGTLEVNKALSLWVEELTSAPRARSRTEAALALGKEGSWRAVAALSTAMPKERSWAAQAAMAKGLGMARTPESKAALLHDGPKLRHPKARRAAAAALGEFRRDEAVGKALTAWLKAGDASAWVEGECARSLGKLRLPGTLPTLVSLLQRQSFQDAVAVGAIDGMAELQDPAAFDRVERLTEWGQPSHRRRAALPALAKLAEVSDKKLRAVEALTERLRDGQFRVQMATFGALQELGDRRAIPALESTPFQDGRARRAARETLRSLRTAEPGAKELAALREEMDKLKEETRALKSRVEALSEKRARR